MQSVKSGKSDKSVILFLFFAFCLLPFRLFGQDEIQHWFFTSGIASPAIIPTASLDLTTGAPIVPYDNLCLRMTPQQVLKFIHNGLLDLSDSTVELVIQWDMSMTSFPLGNVNIFGQNNNSGSYKTIIWFYSASNAFHFKVKDTTYDVYTHNNNQAWHTYKLWYHGGNLDFYVDGDSLYGRTTNFANPDSTFPTQAFSWGSYSEFWDGYIFSDAGNFTGYLDNIYVKVSTTNITDSIVSNTNFNSYTQQPYNSPVWYVWDRNNGPHIEIGQLFSGSQLGGNWAEKDNFDPQFVWRSGERKDTCMYVQIGDSASNNGFTAWSAATSYVRASANRVYPNPTDSTQLIVVGAFSHTRDSAHALSPDIALYNSQTDRFTSCGTGLQIGGGGDYGWWATWHEDTVFIIHTADSVNGIYAPDIAKYVPNTDTWYPLAELAGGILPKKCLLFKDSIWVMSGKYLYAWCDSSWTMKDSFTVISTDHNFFNTDDSMYVFIPGEGMYKCNGDFSHSLVAAHTGYVMPPAYSKGNIYYSAPFYDSATGRLWLGGDFDSLQGIRCNGICYYKDGVIHAVGYGADGVYWGQGEPTTVGMWNRCITGITKWQGEIIAMGNFRYMDSVNIGSNIAMYNDVDGWRAFDYGLDWRPQGACVYNKVIDGITYKPLMVVGDFSSAGGIPAGHIISRLDQPQQLVIAPLIDTFTAQADIVATAYPPTINIWAHSPLRRAITATVTYQINSGVTKSFTMSHSDSSLVVYRGTWFFKWAGTFGASDTIATNDTISYTATFTDDRGNSVDTTDSFLVIYPDYPATPNYVWDWQDLIDSVAAGDSVFAWQNEQDTLTLRQFTSLKHPDMVATGVLFDTTDLLLSNMPHTNAGDSITIVIDMKVTDTNSTAAQNIFSYITYVPNNSKFGAQIVPHASSTYRKLGTSHIVSATITHRTFLTNVGSHYNTFSCFAFYADSASKQFVRVNDVLGADQGAAFSTALNGVGGFHIGDTQGTGGMNGWIIKRIVVYFRLLSAAELTQVKNAVLARP